MVKKKKPKSVVFVPEKDQSEETLLMEVAEKLTRTLEKTRIAEYVDYLQHPWKLLWMNFLIGIARGLGGTIGLALVLALAIYILQKAVMLNLPVISDVITKFIHMVQENLQYLNTKG